MGKTIDVSVAQARSDFGSLMEQVESGAEVRITSGGKPKALLIAYPKRPEPWRVATPDDPAKYGDLQSPVLEDWT